MYIDLHVKCSFFSSDFNDTWIFDKCFEKVPQILNLMSVCPVEDRLFHAEGHYEARIHFSQFCKCGQKLRCDGERGGGMFATASFMLTFWSPRHDLEIAMFVYTTHNEPNYVHTRKTRQSVEQIWNMTGGQDVENGVTNRNDHSTWHTVSYENWSTKEDKFEYTQYDLNFKSF